MMTDTIEGDNFDDHYDDNEYNCDADENDESPP